MFESNDQNESIIKEFLNVDFGYSKMGRCVTFVRPKSEAEVLGVRVGWLEKKLKLGILSNHKKRRNKNSKSKPRTTLVQFLVPKRPVFCKVIWKARVSTHCKIHHPERKVVGSVGLGTVLRVMDISKNRALVACPNSGWNRDPLGWFPNQQFAWISIKAKDGTNILQRVSELSPAVRLSLSRTNSRRTTSYPQSILSREPASINMSIMQSTHRSRPRCSFLKPAIHLDFREKKSTKEYLPYKTPRYPIPINRKETSRSTNQKRSIVSSLIIKPKNPRKVLIDLDSQETKNNYKLKNLIYLDFKVQNSSTEKDNSEASKSSVLGTKLRGSLSRSKSISVSCIPDVDIKEKHPVELNNSKWTENQASQSFTSDARLSSKEYNELPLSKLNDGEILIETDMEKKHSTRENNLSLLIPNSKWQTKRVELRVDHSNSRYNTLTPSSVESKYTSKSSELTEQRYSTSELETESSPMKKNWDLRNYYSSSTKECDSSLPSLSPIEDETPNRGIVKLLKDENDKERGRTLGRGIEIPSVERHRSKIHYRIVDSFPMSFTKKCLKREYIREPQGREVEREAREMKEQLICSADV